MRQHFPAQPDLQIIPIEKIQPENGIRIDGCIPMKIADKAGIQAGDVIMKMGEFTIIDFDDYIEAIKKTNKEKETVIVVKRDGIEFKFFVLLKDLFCRK